jgi:hypothetical protein
MGCILFDNQNTDKSQKLTRFVLKYLRAIIRTQVKFKICDGIIQCVYRSRLNHTTHLLSVVANRKEVLFMATISATKMILRQI